jgi:hypothetical protein
MRSMRFFHPIVHHRVLSRVDLANLCAHRACLMDGCGPDHGPVRSHGKDEKVALTEEVGCIIRDSREAKDPDLISKEEAT